jgi:serine/threonine protein kinase
MSLQASGLACTKSWQSWVKAAWARSIARVTRGSSAIKVLPEQFARNPDRLTRFEREAELLAPLNHPNIASVYGFEEAAPASGIVLELVEGPTLADRIARGPVPVEETLYRSSDG